VFEAKFGARLGVVFGGRLESRFGVVFGLKFGLRLGSRLGNPALIADDPSAAEAGREAPFAVAVGQVPALHPASVAEVVALVLPGCNAKETLPATASETGPAADHAEVSPKLPGIRFAAAGTTPGTETFAAATTLDVTELLKDFFSAELPAPGIRPFQAAATSALSAPDSAATARICNVEIRGAGTGAGLVGDKLICEELTCWEAPCEELAGDELTGDDAACAGVGSGAPLCSGLYELCAAASVAANPPEAFGPGAPLTDAAPGAAPLLEMASTFAITATASGIS
jgi:hypothetical protein